MSHANGKVKFKDGLILCCEYNGTADIMIPNLYETPQEVYDNWRNHPDIQSCTCGKEKNVKIACDYGGGFYWQGRACRYCMQITSGFGVGDDDYFGYDITHTENGLPHWWEYDE